MRSRALWYGLAAFATLPGFYGCGSGGENTELKVSSESTKKVVADAWEWYDDATIRFEHPKNRRVLPLPKTPKGYFVLEPGDIDGLPGTESISILPKSSPPPVGMSLREIALAHLKDAAGEQTRLVGALQNLTLPGGRCVSYMTEGPNVGGCSTPEGNKPVCRLMLLSAECEAWQNIPMEIVSIAEAYPDAGKPSARAREQMAVYERLVRSIEFK